MYRHALKNANKQSFGRRRWVERGDDGESIRYATEPVVDAPAPVIYVHEDRPMQRVIGFQK